jgi:hypothetical protein
VGAAARLATLEASLLLGRSPVVGPIKSMVAVPTPIPGLLRHGDLNHEFYAAPPDLRFVLA